MTPQIPQPNDIFALDIYQLKAHSTCNAQCNNIDYPMHEIIEEVAELYDKFYQSIPTEQREPLLPVYAAIMQAGKLAKVRAKSVRHGIVPDYIQATGTPDQREEMALELGDIQWGVAECARQLGFRLSQVAIANNDKLARRKQEGKIEGDGDHR